MRALVYDGFGVLPTVRDVPDPRCPPDGAVISVDATGLCRSDWHAWSGHDDSVLLPHIGGHEYAGTIAALGSEVTGFELGQRVTVPFVCACGACVACLAGFGNVCERQTQPGFDLPGSFAGFVAVRHAEVNLVRLPESVTATSAAALGCRFATAHRAVVGLGRVQPGQWVAVHGCGGVGLSAVQVARSRGAHVVALDVAPAARAAATEIGADTVLDPAGPGVATAVRDVTGGGAHLSLDAFGSRAAFAASVSCLRVRGRHVQVGLLLADQAGPPLDAGALIGRELEIIGSHGMATHDYPAMLADVESGALDPAALVHRTVTLEEAGPALASMDTAPHTGITVVTDPGRLGIPSPGHRDAV